MTSPQRIIQRYRAWTGVFIFIPLLLIGIVVFVEYEDTMLLPTVPFLYIFFMAMSSRESDQFAKLPASGFGRRALALFLMFVVVVVAANYVINPLGIYDTHVFDPIVPDYFQEQLDRYASSSPPPEVIIFGSSRSARMPPDYIESVTGLSAFNAYVNSATPTDYLNLLRYMIDRGTPPRVIIIGLSTEQLIQGASFDERKVDLLISLEQTLATVRLLRFEIMGGTKPQAIPYGQNPLRIRDSDTPADANRLENSASSYLGRRFVNYRPLDMVDFEKLIVLCREYDIKVVVYHPPLHPQLLKLYEQQYFPQMKAELFKELEKLGIDAAYDFTDINTFGGSETMFRDAIHVTSEMDILMLNVMLPDIFPKN